MYTLAVSRNCNVTCLLGSRRSGTPNVIAKPIGVPLLLLPRSLSPNNIDYIYPRETDTNEQMDEKTSTLQKAIHDTAQATTPLGRPRR